MGAKPREGVAHRGLTEANFFGRSRHVLVYEERAERDDQVGVDAAKVHLPTKRDDVAIAWGRRLYVRLALGRARRIGLFLANRIAKRVAEGRRARGKGSHQGLEPQCVGEGASVEHPPHARQRRAFDPKRIHPGEANRDARLPSVPDRSLHRRHR